MRRIPFILLLLTLGACGGSSEDRGITEQYGLSVRAEAWENHMPTGYAPGQEPACTALIVRFVVTSQEGLPADTTATSVALEQRLSAKSTRLQASSNETGLSSSNTIDGVARGCRSDAFREGDDLDVLVRVRSSGLEDDVRTTVRLYYAH